MWTIECPNHDRAHASFFETWGTRYDNRDAIDLLEMVCNNKEIVVKYTAEETERTGRTGVNRDATVAAQAKATKISEAFQKWIFADENDTPFAASDGGVEQPFAQKNVVLHRQRYDNGRVLASLGLVNRHGICERELV